AQVHQPLYTLFYEAAAHKGPCPVVYHHNALRRRFKSGRDGLLAGTAPGKYSPHLAYAKPFDYVFTAAVYILRFHCHQYAVHRLALLERQKGMGKNRPAVKVKKLFAKGAFHPCTLAR